MPTILSMNLAGGFFGVPDALEKRGRTSCGIFFAGGIR